MATGNFDVTRDPLAELGEVEGLAERPTMLFSMPAPFPRTLRYDEESEWWTGTISLPEFDAVRIDVTGRQSTSKSIELIVEADDAGPSDAQAAAYTYCIENESKVLASCLAGLRKTAKKMRPIFARWNTPERLEEILPEGPTPEKLRSRVRLTTLQITGREKNGIAYLEYDFNCAWDREHGLLVVLHRDRLVHSGLTGEGWSDR